MTTITPEQARQHLETPGLKQAVDFAARRERCLTSEPGWQNQAGAPVLPAHPGAVRSSSTSPSSPPPFMVAVEVGQVVPDFFHACGGVGVGVVELASVVDEYAGHGNHLVSVSITAFSTFFWLFFSCDLYPRDPIFVS